MYLCHAPTMLTSVTPVLVGSHAYLDQCVSGLSSHSLKQKIACKVRSEYATVRDLPPPNQTVAKMTGQAPSTSLNSETPELCMFVQDSVHVECVWVCGVVHGCIAFCHQLFRHYKPAHTHTHTHTHFFFFF